MNTFLPICRVPQARDGRNQGPTTGPVTVVIAARLGRESVGPAIAGAVRCVIRVPGVVRANDVNLFGAEAARSKTVSGSSFLVE